MPRKEYICLILFLLLTLALGLFIQSPDHIWGGDFALYIEQAQALWDGTVYDLWLDTSFSVDKSTEHPFSPKLYPWGLPFLFAPVVKIVGLNYGMLKLYQLILFLGTLIIFFHWLRQHFSDVEALILTSVWAFHPVVIMYNNFIISDIPYTGALVLSLLCINRCYACKKDFTVSWQRWVGCGIAIWLAVLIRQEGKLLLCSLALIHTINIYRSSEPLSNYLKANWQEWIPYSVVIGGMLFLNLMLPNGTASNIRQIRPEDITFLDNLYHYSSLFETLMGEWFSGILYMLTGFFVIWGMFSRLTEDLLYVSYILLHLGVLAVWPYTSGVRFLFPLFPLYVYFCYRGLQRVAGLWLNSRTTQTIATSFIGGWALLLLVQMIIVAATFNREEMIDGPEHPASQEVFSFIRAYTEPNAKIIFFKPRVLHLYTGRKSFIMEFKKGLSKGDYYVMHKQQGNYDQVPIYNYPNLEQQFLQQVFKNELFVVYKIIK